MYYSPEADRLINLTRRCSGGEDELCWLFLVATTGRLRAIGVYVLCVDRSQANAFLLIADVTRPYPISQHFGCMLRFEVS